MKKTALIFFLITLFINQNQISKSQTANRIIPEQRQINWTPGLESTIPEYTVSTNVRDFGAIGNGQIDDTRAFKNAINSTLPGKALLIPEGTYLISSTLKITKSIVLRGEGFSKTKLMFNTENGANCISIESSSTSDWENVKDGFNKGSSSIKVDNNSIFHSGDFIQIIQDNDPAVYSDGRSGHWNNTSVGQILKITFISDKTIKLNKELYYSYNSLMNPRIRSLEMVQNAGIENMYIERINKTKAGSTFSLTNAAYCWIRNIWSEKTLTAHIIAVRTYRSEIRNNYFHDSHLHGSGGQGYGIRLEAQSTDNLIENNIFEHLRHSMVVQFGATGNVFGYNYSKDPFLEEGNNWLMSDIALHGHYSYQNLFEGNTVQYILADNVWGTNGPTTFFRNRIEKNVSHYLSDSEKFAFVKIEKNNPYQNILCNELGIESTQSREAIITNSDNTIIHGNYNYNINSISWDQKISERAFPNSLYLIHRPIWFGSLPWPFIGGDVSPNTNQIPAQKRYEEGNFVSEN